MAKKDMFTLDISDGKSRADTLDAMTAQVESGGREYNKDGSRVTSPKGARGIMQLMPTTARDPGFGLKPSNGTPEDDLRLAKEYRATMEKRYGGDLSKMWAAFNAGPGAVDRRIKSLGADWLSGMPQETKDYVAKLSGKVSGGSAKGKGFSMQEITMPAKDKPYSAAPRNVQAVANNGTSNSPVADPFLSAITLKTTGGEIVTRNQEQVKQADEMFKTNNEIQEKQTRRLADIVAEKRKINDAALANTKAFVADELNPRAEAIQKTNDRIEELRAAKGGKKFINSILGNFLSKYNPDVLRDKRDELARDIQSESALFVQKLNEDERTFNALDRKLLLDNALEENELQNLSEDQKLFAQSTAARNTVFSSLLDLVGANETVIRSQRVAREEYLATKDDQYVESLANKAKSMGGKILVDGVEFNSEDLEQASKARIGQNLQFEGMVLSNQTQKLAHANAFQDSYLDKLDLGQLKSLEANGFVYRGQKFSPGSVQQRIAGMTQNAFNRSQLEASTPSGVEAKGQITALQSGINTQIDFSTRYFGSVPGQVQQKHDQYKIKLASFAARMQKANSNGTGDIERTVISSEIAKMNEEIAASNKSLASNLGEGNGKFANYFYREISGEPIRQQDSMELIREVNKSNAENKPIPRALRNDRRLGVMTNAYQKAETAFNAEAKRQGLKLTGAAREQYIEQTFMKIVGDELVDYNMNTMVQSFPEIARRAGSVDFRGVSNQKWQALVAKGDSIGLSEVASELGIQDSNGITGGQKLGMALSGKYSGADSQEVNQLARAPGVVKRVSLKQQEGFLETLGTEKTSTGQTLRESFIAVAQDPKLLSVARNWADTTANVTPGGKASSALTQSDLGNSIQSYANMQVQLDDQMKFTNPGKMRSAQYYQQNPIAKLALVSQMSGDMSSTEFKDLIAALPKGTTNNIDTAVTAIERAKFENPALEKIRQKAASNLRESIYRFDQLTDPTSASQMPSFQM